MSITLLCRPETNKKTFHISIRKDNKLKSHGAVPKTK